MVRLLQKGISAHDRRGSHRSQVADILDNLLPNICAGDGSAKRLTVVLLCCSLPP